MGGGAGELFALYETGQNLESKKWHKSTTAKYNVPLINQGSKLTPGRVAQSVGHLTRKSGVLGSIPGLATYFRFSFRLFQGGQLSIAGESMCTKCW